MKIVYHYPKRVLQATTKSIANGQRDIMYLCWGEIVLEVYLLIVLYLVMPQYNFYPTCYLFYRVYSGKSSQQLSKFTFAGGFNRVISCGLAGTSNCISLVKINQLTQKLSDSELRTKYNGR